MILAPRGLNAVDNVFQAGRVLDPNETYENAVVLRAFNDQVLADSR